MNLPRARILLFAIIIGICTDLSAQSYYIVSDSIEYQDIENSTSITNNSTWDDLEYSIPIPFDFKFFGETANELHFDPWGFGAEILVETENSEHPGLICVLSSDIADRGYDEIKGTSSSGGLSNVSYKIEGNFGDQILKIEWSNVGFLAEHLRYNTMQDSIHFQLWIYEADHSIEMRYGSNSIKQQNAAFDGLGGPSIGIFPQINLDSSICIEDGYNLAGNWASPQLKQSPDYIEYHISPSIAENRLLRFQTSEPASIDPQKQLIHFRIYPNPATDKIYVRYNPALFNVYRLELMNYQGRLVAESEEPSEINILNISSGIYFLQVHTEMGIITKRIVVQ